MTGCSKPSTPAQRPWSMSRRVIENALMDRPSPNPASMMQSSAPALVVDGGIYPFHDFSCCKLFRDGLYAVWAYDTGVLSISCP